MIGFTHKRKWIYPQTVTGQWQRLRGWTFGALHLILFVTPWVTINGNPALRIDLPVRVEFVAIADGGMLHRFVADEGAR